MPYAMQLLHLVRQDRATAAAEDQDVGATRGQQVVHVLEVLEVAALIRGDGNSRRILLDGAFDDLGGRAIVAEVNHLGT